MVSFVCVCFKQKTAYERRISDWSSDVCSSDLLSASPSVDGPAGGLADRGISLSLLERRAIWIGMHDAAAGYGPLPSGSTWIRRLIGVFADGPRKQTFNLSQIPVLKPFGVLVCSSARTPLI